MNPCKLSTQLMKMLTLFPTLTVCTGWVKSQLKSSRVSHTDTQTQTHIRLCFPGSISVDSSIKDENIFLKIVLIFFSYNYSLTTTIYYFHCIRCYKLSRDDSSAQEDMYRLYETVK